MNKRGVAEGLSWFFAIIVIVLILVLFYVSVSFYLRDTTPSRGDFYLGDFYKKDSLRQTIFMEDYAHNGIYNNFSYQIFEADYSLSVNSNFVLFLDSICKEIFSKRDSMNYLAFIYFSLGMNSLFWTSAGMDGPFSNDIPSDSENLISKLKEDGITVAYANIWDIFPGEINFVSHQGRLYRIYFLNKGHGFVRFGTSAVQR